MIKEILTRIKQGKRTMKFPAGTHPPLSDLFMGRPIIDSTVCKEDCFICADVCPVGAISSSGTILDLGKCIFCGECSRLCPNGAITFTKEYRLSVSHRHDFLIERDQTEMELAAELDKKMKKLFGRSLKLRVVSAGGCGACEADVNVLNTIGWDLSRFGIQYVASPRHADGLLVTGPVTKNMELALMKTYNALAEPKLVIAVGACAVSGGLYCGHEETCCGVDSLIPVDLYIPGCPPHPLTILDGLLRLVGKIETKRM